MTKQLEFIMQGRTVNSAHILVTNPENKSIMAASHGRNTGTSNVIAGELAALVPGIPGQQNFLSSVYCYRLLTMSQHADNLCLAAR